jgi:hypothetical protein
MRCVDDKAITLAFGRIRPNYFIGTKAVGESGFRMRRS